jgi:energy-coupling factor transport system permease protein
MNGQASHGPSGLYALHPLTKLALMLMILIAGAALPTTALVVAVFPVVLVPLAVIARRLGAFLFTCLRIVSPFVVSLVLIQGFFTPGSTVLIHVGPLRFTLEGLQVALRFSSRLLIGLGAATLLMMITRPDELMRGLVEHGLPNQIAYIIAAALQIVPTFQARAHAILDAQRSRGLETEGPITVRVRALAPLVGPLILSSLMEIEERAIALEARAFNRAGRRTSMVILQDSRLQTLARWMMLLLCVALIAVRAAVWRTL